MVYPNIGIKGEERAEDMGEDSGPVSSTVKVRSCGCVA